MNILEELYYGNVFPNEKCAKLDEQTKELLSLLGHTNASFTLDTYTHITTDMQHYDKEETTTCDFLFKLCN